MEMAFFTGQLPEKDQKSNRARTTEKDQKSKIARAKTKEQKGKRASAAEYSLTRASESPIKRAAGIASTVCRRYSSFFRVEDIPVFGEISKKVKTGIASTLAKTGITLTW